MSVKDFKFVSPGVFINEIDNSFIPKSADTIGPVVIGRAQRGISMQPVKVQSYSEFVEVFGDTVPGDAGGDVYRDSVDLQSPMYGTYAAKAFLRSNVAPLTYIRLLGHDSDSADSTAGSKAGWKTDSFLGTTNSGGGTFGLWVAPSGSNTVLSAHEGAWAFTGSNAFQLAAVFYNDNGGMALAGNTWGHATGSAAPNVTDTKSNAMILSDANGTFTAQISGSTGATEKITFSMNDNSEDYIRRKFSTNPMLRRAGDFYTNEKDWWLGETFDQEIRDAGLNSGQLVGVILGIQLQGGSDSEGPGNMYGQAAREAVAGWFIAQNAGAPTDYEAENMQKLFRLHGRGHGEWLMKHCKVSIEKIRPSSTTTSEYGTFSVVIRSISDSDNAVQVMERFDNLNLNPNSPNYIGSQIGTEYYSWSETDRKLILEGDGHPNRSKFIRVELSDVVRGGALEKATSLPFGYYAPPKFSTTTLRVSVTGSRSGNDSKYIIAGSQLPDFAGNASVDAISSSQVQAAPGFGSASFAFPEVRLRNSASDGGLVNYRDAYFGFQNTRSSGSTVAMPAIWQTNRLWSQTVGDDPTTSTGTGIDGFSTIFSLDDILTGSSTTGFFYRSGSHKNGLSVSGQTGSASTYKTLLDLGVDRFTAPFWGASDGLNIRVPDPMYNAAMSELSDNDNSYIYYTWRRAIDSIADPEFVNMNLLAAPGLGLNSLTAHMINTCENRADAMALIDLEDAYKPRAEGKTGITKESDRVTYNPTQLSNNLRDRRIDSSYGCTFYPWVQTRDENTGQLVWIPPTVAMMGVLASSERKSKIWFAPAGFNRGGLSDGAAGIPITQVTTRLSSRDRDTLYNARINPIASFPSTGIVVFGQKTLQERQSALDRINVRRLVIYLKKQISILSTQILFEQNVQATWNRFKGLIDPFLANVTTEYGITDYRLILDESTTTADLIDQNIMYAKIMIKPARAIEFIAIDFVIASTGASFDD